MIKTFPENLLADIYGQAPEGAVTEDRTEGLSYVLSNLREREREIVRLRYEKMLTYREIGETMGFSTERARQLLVKTLRKMRNPLNTRYITYGMKGAMLRKITEELEPCPFCGEKPDMHELPGTGEYITICACGCRNPSGPCETPEEAAGNWNTRTHIKTEGSDPIEKLELSVRAYNCLKRAGVDTVGELRGRMKSDTEWYIRISSLGRKTVEEIDRKMKERGLM
ncbi:MAG: sigma-70 family RNA polymerase sigma factor [Hominilimicola sp.]